MPFLVVRFPEVRSMSGLANQIIHPSRLRTREGVSPYLRRGLVAHCLAPVRASCGRWIADWRARNVEATLLIDRLHLGCAEIIRLVLEPAVLRATAVRVDVGEAALLSLAVRFACLTVSHLRDVDVRAAKVDTYRRTTSSVLSLAHEQDYRDTSWIPDLVQVSAHARMDPSGQRDMERRLALLRRSWVWRLTR